MLDETELLPALRLNPIYSIEDIEEAFNSIIQADDGRSAGDTKATADPEATGVVARQEPGVTDRGASSGQVSDAPTAGYEIPVSPGSPLYAAVRGKGTDAQGAARSAPRKTPAGVPYESVVRTDPLWLQQQVGTRYSLVRMLGR